MMKKATVVVRRAFDSATRIARSRSGEGRMPMSDPLSSVPAIAFPWVDDAPKISHRYRASAHRFLHERADPCLFGSSQLLQPEDDRPHGAFVAVRRVAEAQRRVPLLELLVVLHEADDSADV